MSLLLRRRMLLSRKKKSLNVFNMVERFVKETNGLILVGENNTLTINGTVTKVDVMGDLRTQKNFKANTPYTFRLTKLGGGGTGTGASVRFYVFEKYTYKAAPCNLWNLNSSEAVGTYTFTEEHIANGVGCGIYIKPNAVGDEFNNYTVRADIIEGSYTKDTMPPFEPYED